MIPLYNMDGSPAKPMGFPMCQNRISPAVWGYAMEMYPPKQIVEIGTLNGAFTTALAFHSWLSKCKVYSFDLCVCPNEDWKALSAFLGIEFIRKDVFDNVDTVKSLVQRPGTSYLLCDGGNKRREFNLFAPFIKPGDVIAAHDYCCGDPEEWWPWQEIQLKDVQETVTSLGLVPFMQDYLDTAGWLAFKRP